MARSDPTPSSTPNPAIAGDCASLEHLIESSYSREAADAHARHQVTTAQLAAMAEVGRNILQRYRPVPGACAMLSAIYARQLRSITDAVYMVAGALDVAGIRVFGTGTPISGSLPFLQSDPDWDGHAWVMVGDFVADISLFRTAKAPSCHPMLKTHVTREFGLEAGLLVCRSSDTIRSGLQYRAHYVLTDIEIETLDQSARDILPTG